MLGLVGLGGSGGKVFCGRLADSSPQPHREGTNVPTGIAPDISMSWGPDDAIGLVSATDATELDDRIDCQLHNLSITD